MIQDYANHADLFDGFGRTHRVEGVPAESPAGWTWSSCVSAYNPNPAFFPLFIYFLYLFWLLTWVTEGQKNASALISVYINRFSICDCASKLESVSSDIWFVNTIAGSRKLNLSSSIVLPHPFPPPCLEQSEVEFSIELRNCNGEHTTQADKHHANHQETHLHIDTH